MPKLILISDTHNLHNQVSLPEGDILIHAGDMCMRGTLDEVQRFSEWLSNQPHKQKIVIAGNHDWPFAKNKANIARALIEETGAAYLQDQAINVGGLKVYGSPWQPWFFSWAFNVPRGMLKPIWDKIPDDTDILITHGPPKGILDHTANGERAGCDELLTRVLQVKPMLHVFGHIHPGYGEKEFMGTHYANASVVNEAYKVVNEPIVVDI